MDVLQDRGKDRHMAAEATQEENPLVKSRCEELQEENLEMGNVTDGFEGIMYRAMEEAQKRKKLAKEIQTF
ncbi:hypothetical protein HPG69_002292 [Diceros bicornis minor]|uniref:Transforming acidic coiled-coil-containing protein C-terminal domain-containing protein n=1 Tax=Diceros bicornis minor TaxID=77932 RepID=A0A7J7FD02_DICBM|nr:hypothetical protein HPG69_002292 [Diceros bicornis minor]